MPFHWKKKTDRVPASPIIIKEAVMKVLEHDCSIRDTAKKYNIDKMTLSRYIKKYIEKGEAAKLEANYNTCQIFTPAEESYLAGYLLTVSKANHGITAKEVRRIAFLFAKANDKKITQNWIDNESASLDWFRGFLLRNKELSLRSPESKGLGCSTTISNLTVSDFYNFFKSAMTCDSFNSENNYHLEETDVHFLTAEQVESQGSLPTSMPSSSENINLEFANELKPDIPNIQIQPSSTNSCPISTKTTPEQIQPFSKRENRRKSTKPTKILIDTPH